jgi:hypothetical protein
MSECVVRMEIPENCLKCPLRNQCEIFCDWFWHVVGRAATKKPYPKPFDKGCHILTILPNGHGRIVDADEFLKRAIGTKCFDEDDSRMLTELVGESITIVPAERRET